MMSIRRVLLHAFMAAALLGALPGGAAWAAGVPRALTAQAGAPLELARVDCAPVPVVCDPASIECGMQCGMTEMCGQDPCLCGPVDEFGACACNGRQTVCPAFSLDDDGGGAVALVDVLGTAYLVPLAEGPADVVVRASLPHHADAVVPLHVEVAGAGPLDVAKVVVALAALVALLVAVAFVVRGGVRRGRGFLARRQGKEGLK